MSLKALLPTFDNRAAKAIVFERDELTLARDDFAIRQATVSSALASVFRGKFCDAILPKRQATSFQKGDVIYDVGRKDRTFFLLICSFGEHQGWVSHRWPYMFGERRGSPMGMGSEARNARMVTKAKPDATTTSAAKSQIAGRGFAGENGGMIIR